MRFYLPLNEAIIWLGKSWESDIDDGKDKYADVWEQMSALFRVEACKETRETTYALIHVVRMTEKSV